MENYVLGLHHIGIKTPDLEKGIKFYTEVLGFTLVNRIKPGNVELVFCSREIWFLSWWK